MKKMKKDTMWAYLFILVPLCTFTIFTLYPVVSAAITSFQKYRPLGSEWIGFTNYINTFKNSLFYKSLKNTLVYTVMTVPVGMLLSFTISIMILPFKKRIQSVFKAAFYLPAIASGVALSFVWKWIYDPLPSGLLNSVFHIFGISNQNWLGSGKTAMISLVIMAVFAGLGGNIIIYIAALLGIDPSYYEAADMDGATFIQKIRFVVWPLVKPTTIFLTITSVINGFQSFQNAYLMTGGGPDNETTMAGLLIFNRAFKYFEYGEACAQALILAGIIAIFAILQFKLSANDVEY
ncbi:carbohydrate ABC transporter permease [Velocimicrobium porci]|uniref:Sugar ABC transporter permease n=1 Tax=Velocimicrobium porci TaxID=2606634 RepID=A0A6L5XXU6_9FIRM|nr:sugar ABC transporter permease [Velocimicrobium porci]MSS63595.1 sugar ABC transporter permease [Velocimicrobium porci]